MVATMTIAGGPSHVTAEVPQPLPPTLPAEILGFDCWSLAFFFLIQTFYRDRGASTPYPPKLPVECQGPNILIPTKLFKGATRYSCRKALKRTLNIVLSSFPFCFCYFLIFFCFKICFRASLKPLSAQKLRSPFLKNQSPSFKVCVDR